MSGVSGVFAWLGGVGEVTGRCGGGGGVSGVCAWLGGGGNSDGLHDGLYGE